MELPNKNGAPKAEERSSSDENHVTSSPGEREGAAQQHVSSLSHDEKQSLFIKKLYKLSQKYMDETPEECLAQHKVKAVASPLSQPTEIPTEMESVTPASPLMTFASRLSEMSSCVTLDYLCTGRNSDMLRRPHKKKSPILQRKPDIPETITLQPNHVSRLEDDDSLTRHINALARRTPPPQVVAVDDASKSSPQCVAELTYEMEISRIIPVEEKPKEKRRFSGFRANDNNRDLESDEMEI